jgi:hypothetical protein
VAERSLAGAPDRTVPFDPTLIGNTLLPLDMRTCFARRGPSRARVSKFAREHTLSAQRRRGRARPEHEATSSLGRSLRNLRADPSASALTPCTDSHPSRCHRVPLCVRRCSQQSPNAPPEFALGAGGSRSNRPSPPSSRTGRQPNAAKPRPRTTRLRGTAGAVSLTPSHSDS